MLTFSMNSQIIAIDTDAKCDRDVAGAYYNDINSYLDPYVGTWQYQNGNELLIVKLRKVYSVNNLNSEDLLIGEYKYINSSNIEKLNTLSNFNVDSTNQYNHAIEGNCVFDYYDYLGGKDFTDCIPSIGSVGLTHRYEDITNNISGGGLFYMAIKSQGTITQLKLFISTDTTNYQMSTDSEGNQYVETVNTNVSLIPNGYYILTKQ